MSNPGQYRGIYSAGQMPGGIVEKRFAYSRRHAGRKVDYYEVWVKRDDEIPEAFPDDKLKKNKVAAVDKMFNRKKNKWI